MDWSTYCAWILSLGNVKLEEKRMLEGSRDSGKLVVWAMYLLSGSHMEADRGLPSRL